MFDKDPINFLLAGVGGQGTLLASDLLAEVGLEAGYDVKQAEVHGMAQRGGSVSSHVRWGSVVYSPLIAPGQVDILLAFEQLEALRMAHFLRPDGLVLASQQAIAPITVSAGPALYPSFDYLAEEMARFSRRIYWLPALQIARSLGNEKAANVVMLGGLSALLQIEPQIWLKVIEKRVPARFLQLNHLAFQRGREALSQACGQAI